jgi:hypothetical protein
MKKQMLEDLRINLRMFDDGGDGTGDNGAQSTPPDDGGTGDNPGTDGDGDNTPTPPDDDSFSRAERDSYADKRINDEKKKWDEQNKQSIKDAVADALRKQQMTDEERRQEEEAEKLQEVENRQRELDLRERRLNALDLLATDDIPKELLGALDLSSDETMQTSVQEVGKLFKEAVQKGITAGINQRVNQNAHAPAGNQSTGNPTSPFDAIAKSFKQ